MQRDDVLKKSILIIFLCIIGVFCIFYSPEKIAIGINKGLVVCGSVIIPSLFPFLVICSFLIRTDSLSIFNNLCNKISNATIKLPGCAFPVFIISLFAGYPVGAKLSNTLYKKGKLSKNQAQNLSTIACSAGPAYIINGIGFGMLGSKEYGYILFVSHLISSCICAIIFSKNQKTEQSHPISTQKGTCVTDSFVLGVMDASQSIISICTWSILFSGFCSLLSVLPKHLYTSLNAILEVTNGCLLFAEQKNIPLISAVCGFGGISIICQCISVGKETSPRFQDILKTRLCHGVISFTITTVLIKIFPQSIPVLSTFSKAIIVHNYSTAKLSFALLFMIVVFFGFCNKKMCRNL